MRLELFAKFFLLSTFILPTWSAWAQPNPYQMDSTVTVNSEGAFGKDSSLVWISGEDFARSHLDYFQVLTNKELPRDHRFLRRNTIKRIQRDLQIFNDHHIVCDRSTPACIFESEKDVLMCDDLGHGCHIVYSDDNWTLFLASMGSGIERFFTYVFQNMDQHVLKLKGVLTGDLISANYNTVSYSIKSDRYLVVTLNSEEYNVDMNQTCSPAGGPIRRHEQRLDS